MSTLTEADLDAIEERNQGMRLACMDPDELRALIALARRARRLEEALLDMLELLHQGNGSSITTNETVRRLLAMARASLAPSGGVVECWVPIAHTPGAPQPRIADGIYIGIRSDGHGGFEGLLSVRPTPDTGGGA